MRVTSWNCLRGADVLHGLSLLSPLRSDLITLQECRRPASDSASVIWRGTDPRQGVAVVSTEAAARRRRPSIPPPYRVDLADWRETRRRLQVPGGRAQQVQRLGAVCLRDAGVADPPVSQTAVCDMRTRAPSSTRRRVSYPVSDSMSCRRRARGPVPCAARVLRSAWTDGLGGSLHRSVVQAHRHTPELHPAVKGTWPISLHHVNAFHPARSAAGRFRRLTAGASRGLGVLAGVPLLYGTSSFRVLCALLD